MTASYSIKEVATRTGFPPATLRFYDEIGLVVAPERTPAGYRRYDDRSLQRLAFVARAKQLGCTLEEIAELAVAWDGGSCGPVQDRLRELVTSKEAETRARIAELTTLADDLQRALDGLGRHRPDGPCDDACGCVAPPGEALTRQPVSFGRRPVTA